MLRGFGLKERQELSSGWTARDRGEMLESHLVKRSCDSWAVARIVRLGSVESKRHEVATKIRGVTRELQIELELCWFSRDEMQIQLCEGVNRDFDTSDYRLSTDNFGDLARQVEG